MKTDLIEAARQWKLAHPDFPLGVHPSGKAGRWYKRVNGKPQYFGPITEDVAASAQAAKDLWKQQEDDLRANRKPREKVSGDGPSVVDICFAFMTSKKSKHASEEISSHTLRDYERVCKLLVSEFGSRPVSDLREDDFAKLRTKLIQKGNAPEGNSKRPRQGLGPIALANHVQRIRTVLRSANNPALNDLMLRECFEKPSRKTIRKHKQKQRDERGAKLFTPAEIKLLLEKAGPQLKAMILLALNCGFGNSDCGQLPLARVDLKKCWHDFPRPKTSSDRRAPLWPETVQAMLDVLAKRKPPADKELAKLVFLTKQGGSFYKDSADSPISKEFSKLMKACGIEGAGRNFYTLRHVFRTAASGSKDVEAIRFVMGHAHQHVEGEYIEGVEDDRLQAVVDHVHAKLFPDDTDGGEDGQRQGKQSHKGGADKQAEKPSARQRATVTASGDRPQFRVVGIA